MSAQKLDIEFEEQEDLPIENEEEGAIFPREDDLSFDIGRRDESTSQDEVFLSEKEEQKNGEDLEKKSSLDPEFPFREEEAIDLEKERQKRGASQELPQGENLSVGQVNVFAQNMTTQRSRYQLGDELDKAFGGNQVLAIELEARIKVEVTRKLAKLKAKTHGKNVILNQKVKKILSVMSKKAPNLKNELIMIKKLIEENASLSDFDDFED